MADEDVVVDAPELSEMSRKERPEICLNLKQVENLNVFDEWGRKTAFGELYKQQRTIIVFVRHFLCFIGKEYVDDLALIPENFLKEAGVKLVVIGCAPRKFIQPFRAATGYKGPMYVDPDRELYKKIGCLEKATTDGSSNLKVSRHIKSGFLMGILKSTWRGMRYRELQGDVDQQGAAFILGPGDEVSFKHTDLVPSDQVPINDLLAMSGVEQVNFTHDTRVTTV